MTPDEVLDQIDFPLLDGFTRYWRNFPPLHVLAAAYLGYEAPKKADDKPREVDENFLAQLMTQFEQSPR